MGCTCHGDKVGDENVSMEDGLNKVGDEVSMEDGHRDGEVSMEDGLGDKVGGEDTLGDKNGEDDNSNNRGGMAEEG